MLSYSHVEIQVLIFQAIEITGLKRDIILYLNFDNIWISLTVQLVKFLPTMQELSSFQFSRSVVSDSRQPHELQHARPPCPSPTPGVHPNPSIESMIPSSHLILCRSLLLLHPILPSIKVLSNESTFRMRWSKFWSFRFSISPSNEHPGLISFRMDWLDLLAVQGTLKSLLQHHSSKHQCFGPQLSSQSNSHIHT